MKPLKKKTSRLRLIFAAVGLVALMVVLGAGLWFSQQSQDVGSDASSCSGATNCSVRCNDGHVSSDSCPAYGAYGSCGQWAQDACGPHGGVREMLNDGGVGSGNTNNAGAGGGNNNGPYICPQNAATAVGCRGKAVNTVVPFGNNESCTCKRSGDACACRTGGGGGTTNPSEAPEPIGQVEARCPSGQNSECPANFFCNPNKVCKQLRTLGANCANDNQCASNFCGGDGKCNCFYSTACPDPLKQYCLVNYTTQQGTCSNRHNRGEKCQKDPDDSCLAPWTCNNVIDGKCIKPPTR